MTSESSEDEEKEVRRPAGVTVLSGLHAAFVLYIGVSLVVMYTGLVALPEEAKEGLKHIGAVDHVFEFLLLAFNAATMILLFRMDRRTPWAALCALISVVTMVLWQSRGHLTLAGAQLASVPALFNALAIWQSLKLRTAGMLK